jgi:hypothetical protein
MVGMNVVGLVLSEGENEELLENVSKYGQVAEGLYMKLKGSFSKL